MTSRAPPCDRRWPFQRRRPIFIEPIAGPLAHVGMAVKTLRQPLKKAVVVGCLLAETAGGPPGRRHVRRGQLDQFGGGVHHAI